MAEALAFRVDPADRTPPRRALRADIEAAIDAALDAAHRLILLLDVVDGDTNLEAEEPDAGAREWWGQGVQRFDVGAVA